jgi:hypothetical protein
MGIGLRLAAKTRTNAAIQGAIKLAQLMELPESALEDLAKRIEASPLFKQLAAVGVLGATEIPATRFVARRYAGYGLRMSGGGLPELADGNCDLVRLMQGMGQERFEEWFLGDKPFSDEDRARNCGISVEDARRLREFADRAFIQGEFETAATAPEKVFSAVAGIELEGDKPVLAFFHREVWKKRYRIDRELLGRYLAALPQAEAGKVRNLLHRLELVEHRKTTLYRLLEEVLKTQAEYLRTGEPEQRQPLMQKDLAGVLDVHSSVLCRLISNKSVQLPWGMEAPLAVFFPCAKEINRERLYELAQANPEWRDEELRQELERTHGVKLSRRSIAQYRKELDLGGKGRRADMRTRVHGEMEEFERTKPEPHYTFFNNLHLRLPGSCLRKLLEPENLACKECNPGASAKRRGQSSGEFYAELDRTIVEAGLDQAVLERLRVRANSRDSTGADFDELYDYIFPLYIRLREKGYNHYPDLTS